MSRSRSPSHSRSRSPVKRRDSPAPDQDVCPFLIRVLVTKGKHTPLIDFDEGRLPERDEFQVYAWKHSTPSSLIQLLLPSFPPPYRSPLARFSFRHVYVDASPRGLYKSKDLVSFSGRDLMASISSGNVSVNGNGKVSAMDMELDDGPLPAKGKPIEEKTLEDYGFITGDLLSVSLFVPEPKPSNRGPHANNGASIGAGGGGSALGFGRREGPGQGRESNVERADAEGHWARGEALPPQNANAFRGPRGSFGRDARDEPRDRDRAGFGGGIGIRGAGRRSPGPDRERDGFGRKRSRSPEARDRRESWSRR